MNKIHSLVIFILLITGCNRYYSNEIICDDPELMKFRLGYYNIGNIIDNSFFSAYTDSGFIYIEKKIYDEQSQKFVSKERIKKSYSSIEAKGNKKFFPEKLKVDNIVFYTKPNMIDSLLMKIRRIRAMKQFNIK